MQIYRNYDGNNSAFGDTSVYAGVADPDYLSSFAALRSTDHALTVMVINKQQGSTPVSVSLANFATTGTAETWQIASTTQTSLTPLGSVAIANNSIAATLPSQSITLFVIPPGKVTSPPSAPTGLAASVGYGTVYLTWQAAGGTLPVPAGLSQTIHIAPAAPVITAVTASTTAAGFQVLVTGYTNTREATQAVVQFTPAAGQTLQTTSATVPLTDTANTWFQAASSDQYGGQFVLTLPFTVTGGTASAVGSVSVTLTNTVGTSNSMSGSL